MSPAPTLAALGCLLVTGCGGSDCLGWKEGHRYIAEMVERYDENSSFEFVTKNMQGSDQSCTSDVQPAVGDTITIVPTTLGSDVHECKILRGNVEPQPPLEDIGSAGHPVENGDLLLAKYVGTLDGCETSWLYRFYAVRDLESVLEAPEPGRQPPVVLERTIETRGVPQGCRSNLCTDRFVVRITE